MNSFRGEAYTTPPVVTTLEEALRLPYAKAFQPGTCCFAFSGNIMVNVVV